MTGDRVWSNEAALKRSLRERIKALGPGVVTFAQAAGIGSPGVDYLACVAGRFVAIEVKRNSKLGPTARQYATLHKISVAGGLTFVVNDATSLETCLCKLKELLDEHRQ